MIITVKDIAKIAGVSHTTVLKALHDKPKISSELKEKIKQIAADHNYIVNLNARNLATQDNKFIGMIVTDISLPLISELTKAVEEVARKKGYSVIVTSSDNDSLKEKKAIKGFQELRVAGIIITPSYKGSETLPTLENSQIPFIVLGHLDNIDYITFDDELATLKATQYLLKIGHKRIACVSPGGMNDYPFRSWANGYKKALKEKNIEFQPEYMFETSLEPDSGYRVVGQILALPHRPTAILGFSEKNVIGIIKALKDNQISIPKDMAIISLFDNEMFKYFDPPISALRFPIYLLGELAAEYLIKKISNKKFVLKHQMLNAELILRDST